MCLTIPGKIEKIFQQQAWLADGRQVSLDLTPEAAIGDWVLVSAHSAVAKIDRQEAEETISYFQEAGLKTTKGD